MIRFLATLGQALFLIITTAVIAVLVMNSIKARREIEVAKDLIQRKEEGKENDDKQDVRASKQ